MISFPILSVFSCKKRRKERKNEDVRVFSSLFFPLIEEIEGERREERVLILFFFGMRKGERRGKRNITIEKIHILQYNINQ